MEKNRELRRSPCGLNPSWYASNRWERTDGPVINVIYRPSDADTYQSYANLFKQNSLLFYDVNCDDHSSPIMNPYVHHRGVGVSIEGQLINHYKPGIMLGNDRWWTKPAGD